MIDVYVAMAVFSAHFIGDFICQSGWMANKKSTSIDALIAHVGVYALVLAFVTAFVPNQDPNAYLLFALLNGYLHFATDFFTSKWSSKMWKAGRTHDFFVVVGFDQLIHACCLLLTIRLLFT